MAKKKQTTETPTCNEEPTSNNKDDQASQPNTTHQSEDSQDQQAEANCNTQEKLDDRIQTLQNELASIKDKHLRLYAEFENYKKRTSKERIETIILANKDIIISLLTVLDDFDRAAESFSKLHDGENSSSGFLLIQQKLQNILEQKGLKAMEITKGSPFDPELHEALSSIEVTKEEDKGKIMEVAQKGYCLNDRLIRHAKVIVGK